MDLFDQTSEISPFSLPDGDGYLAQWNESLGGYEISIPNGELFFSEHFFDRKISNRCVQYFQENNAFDLKKTQWNDVAPADFEKVQFKNIQWQQDEIKFYGKTVPLPRLTAWYGDAGAVYTYSGIKSQPNPWNEGLLFIKDEIEQRAGGTYNSVLMNWYRNGEDHMGWHCDDEKELGINATIASANFGEARDFFIRRKDDKSKKLSFHLTHGSLLIMRGELQHCWEHSVPKRKKVLGSRFNLTFREIKS